MTATKTVDKSSKLKVGKNHFDFNNGKRSSFDLTPHDVNVITIIANRPSADRKDLYRLVQQHPPSDNAMDIVTIILGMEMPKRAKPSSPAEIALKKAIANNFVLWSAKSSAETSKPKGLSKPRAAARKAK